MAFTSGTAPEWGEQEDDGRRRIAELFLEWHFDCVRMAREVAEGRRTHLPGLAVDLVLRTEQLKAAVVAVLETQSWASPADIAYIEELTNPGQFSWLATGHVPPDARGKTERADRSTPSGD